MNALLDVIDQLARSKQTVAFAESCTSGLLSASLGAIPGVSRVFQGAIVSYANDVKENLLDVPADLLKTFGAVSEQVAAKMAEGARTRLHSTWGVSVTGIAGPDGGSAEKPVGTVCFAVAGPKLGMTDVETQTWTQKFSGSRVEIQQQSVQTALNLLRDRLASKD